VDQRLEIYVGPTVVNASHCRPYRHESSNQSLTPSPNRRVRSSEPASGATFVVAVTAVARRRSRRELHGQQRPSNPGRITMTEPSSEAAR